MIGGSVQLYRLLESGNPALINWFTKKSPAAAANKEDSLYSLAISTTFTAISLWGKFILSVLIPATDHSLVFAKEGWTALEPSVRQTSLWFVYETSPAFKLGVFSFFTFCFCIWLLERELKRRRVGQRISERVEQVNQRVRVFTTWFQGKYDAVKSEVARESRIAAMLLPHVLYCFACVATYLFMGEHLAPLSRGFAAWFVTIGVPVAFSTQKLIQYDAVCRERLKHQNPDDLNLSSDEEVSDDEEEEDGNSVAQKAAAALTPQKLIGSPRSEYMENALLSVRRRFLSDASLTSPMHDTHGLLNADTVRDFDPVLDWLRYWTVLSVCLLWEQFPVTGHFLGIIPVWPEMRLAFALWLQLPTTRGCDWAFMVIVPFLDRYVKKLPLMTDKTTGLLQQGEQQRGLVVTMLSTMGIVSKKTGKKLLKATEANGNLILVSIPFLLSPTFVTKIGVLVVGLAFPAQASTTCILEIEHFKQELERRKKDCDDAPQQQPTDEDNSSHSGEVSVFWLEYWIVYVLFSLLHGFLAGGFGWWFPLWDQMHLVMLLWMQITYFSGAHHAFNVALVVGRVYRKRRRALNRAVMASRRRGRTHSVGTPQEKIQDLMIHMLPSALLPRLSISRHEEEEDAHDGGDEELELSDEEEETVVMVEEEKKKDRRASSVVATPAVVEEEKKERRASSVVAPPSVEEEAAVGEKDASPE